MRDDPGTGESPAAARRRLRLALRRARETAGLTQGKVAEALDWSVSKVNRIEKGDVTVSTTDLRALLELYGVVDRERAGGCCATRGRRGCAVGGTSRATGSI